MFTLVVCVYFVGLQLKMLSKNKNRKPVEDQRRLLNVSSSSWTAWARSPVGVDCMSNNPLPLSPVGCLPSQRVQVLLACTNPWYHPSILDMVSLYVLCPPSHQTLWRLTFVRPSSSKCGQRITVSLYYNAKYVSVGSNALPHFFIPDFLLPPDVQNPPATLHFKGQCSVSVKLCQCPCLTSVWMCTDSEIVIFRNTAQPGGCEAPPSVAGRSGQSVMTTRNQHHETTTQRCRRPPVDRVTLDGTGLGAAAKRRWRQPPFASPPDHAKP